MGVQRDEPARTHLPITSGRECLADHKPHFLATMQHTPKHPLPSPIHPPICPPILSLTDPPSTPIHSPTKLSFHQAPIHPLNETLSLPRFPAILPSPSPPVCIPFLSPASSFLSSFPLTLSLSLYSSNPLAFTPTLLRPLSLSLNSSHLMSIPTIHL